MSTTPQLLCWLMCDGVHIDPATGKHTILGIFSNIRASQFPMAYPSMIWFLTLTDVTVGPHKLRITMGKPLDEPQTLIEREFESKSPLHRINLINQIAGLRFSAPGNFSITIEIDEQPILVSTLQVGN